MQDPLTVKRALLMGIRYAVLASSGVALIDYRKGLIIDKRYPEESGLVYETTHIISYSYCLPFVHLNKL